MPFIILNIYILIIIVNITYAINVLIKRKYKRLWYFPLPFIFIVLSFNMDLPMRLGLYGKRPTLEFICVRPSVAEDYRKARVDTANHKIDGIIEFFSDVALNRKISASIITNKFRLIEYFYFKTNKFRLNEYFYFKRMQDNKYVYCMLFDYYSSQDKLPTDVVFYIESINFLFPDERSYDMVIPSKYLIKDTTVNNKPHEIL